MPRGIYIRTEEIKRKLRGINRPPLTEEHKKKISLSNKGKKRPPFSKEWKENMSKVHLGVKLSDFHRKRIGEGHKGLNTWSKGKKFTEEHRKNMGKHCRGEKNYRWIKDRTKLKRISKQGERRTSAYFYWRKMVWTRDNWKCIIGDSNCNGKIVAHHILSFTKFPELRYKINNGITLCQFHHPRKRVDETRLIPFFIEMVGSKVII